MLQNRAAGVLFVEAGNPTAKLGWFSATNGADGAAVLRAAAAAARAQGATTLLAPMNVNTWRRYRCVVRTGPAPSEPAPFLLEPFTPAAVQESFEAVHFSRSTTYATLRIPHVEARLAVRARLRADEAGVVFTPLEDRSDSAFVDLLHALADQSFRKKEGFVRTPRAQVEFLYGTSRGLLVPGLSWLASGSSGAPLGFVVAYPDLAAEGCAQTVVKTLAVAPHAPAFLGWALMHRHVVEARAQGFTHGLYALMEKASPLLRYAQDARRMGAEQATVHRTYALYSAAVDSHDLRDSCVSRDSRDAENVSGAEPSSREKP